MDLGRLYRKVMDVNRFRVVYIYALLLYVTIVGAKRNRILTKNGLVQGTTHTVGGKLVDAYLGIPFAKPPVGDLRFKHPQPIHSWKGILNATQFPNSCMQGRDLMFKDFRGAEMWNPNTKVSEDCLYLNVWVPRRRRHKISKSAVLVWIYGGGFYSGTSTLDVYNGDIMAAKSQIIIVSMQYRVGSLGFLAMGHPDAPGNAGLFDQLLALEWIQQNVEQFGGDPHNVTIFGESAGSVSVSMHLLSPLSRNKFQRAILQSGTANTEWAVVSGAEAKRRAIEMATKFPFNCNRSLSTEGIIECLRLHEPSIHFPDNEWITKGIAQFPFVPVVDGAFLTETPEQSLRTGNFKRCPIILGSNKNEGTSYLPYEHPQLFNLHTDSRLSRNNFIDNIDNIFTYYPQYPQLNNPISKSAIRFHYTDWVDQDAPDRNRDNVGHAIADYHFLCMVNSFAKSYARLNNPVYYYYFTHRSSMNPWPAWMGVMHGDEIVYVFGQPFNRSYNYTMKEKRLSAKIISYWTNFAKTGDPNLNRNDPPLNEWPLHTPGGQEYLELHADKVNLADKSLAVGNGPRRQQCAFWNHYLPKLYKSTERVFVVERLYREVNTNPEVKANCSKSPSAVPGIHNYNIQQLVVLITISCTCL